MISILTYHQVDHLSTEIDPSGYAVTPETFKSQMQFLHDNGFTVIDLPAAFAIMSARQPEPKKHVVITFDDGYRDLYTTVRPILAEYGFAATVFLVANRVGKQSDWDEPISLPLLSWDDIRELRRAGFNFGSHTLSHARLTALSEAEARIELEQSKAIIEQELGERVDFFAYPYSAMTTRTQQLVAECGYRGACSGSNLTWNVYNMWRTTCKREDSLAAYRYKAQGRYRHVLRLKNNTVINPIGRSIKQMSKNLLKR